MPLETKFKDSRLLETIWLWAGLAVKRVRSEVFSLFQEFRHIGILDSALPRLVQNLATGVGPAYDLAKGREDSWPNYALRIRVEVLVFP
jgi:hypothetical protein